MHPANAHFNNGNISVYQILAYNALKRYSLLEIQSS